VTRRHRESPAGAARHDGAEVGRGTNASAGLDLLARRLARMPRFARAVVALVRDAFVALGLVLLIGWLRPDLGAAVPVFLLWSVVAGVRLLCAGGGRGGIEIAFASRLDRDFSLQDQLTTWCAVGGDATAEDTTGFRSWLDRSVARRFGSTPLEDVRARAWPSWRPVKVVGVAVVLLLLLRLGVLLWSLPADGPFPLLTASGGGANSQGGGQGRGDGAGGEPEPGSGAPTTPETGAGDPQGEEGEPPPDPPPGRPDDIPTPEPDPGSGDDDLGLPPRSLLDLGVEESFALPAFVGDDGEEGAIETDVGGVVERGSVPDSGTGGTVGTDAGGGGGEPDRPAVDPAEFERARERALRARHVAPSERDVVRQWFEALRERAARDGAETRDAVPDEDRR
jgi:hypothetical protein